VTMRYRDNTDLAARIEMLEAILKQRKDPG
jgi:hypothetical protein